MAFFQKPLVTTFKPKDKVRLKSYQLNPESDTFPDLTQVVGTVIAVESKITVPGEKRVKRVRLPLPSLEKEFENRMRDPDHRNPAKWKVIEAISFVVITEDKDLAHHKAKEVTFTVTDPVVTVEYPALANRRLNVPASRLEKA